MKKQKICIVGGGLTGLATANTLSRLNVEIDLVAGSINNANLASNRTTAISQDNFNFIKKYAIKNNINEMRDLFNKGYKYYKVQLDNTFPDYILNNQGKLNQWIE